MRSNKSLRIQSDKRSLIEACSDGDVKTVQKLLNEGRSVHETTEEGESLLSLACSAGFYELSQVLIAMNANVEDRGIKGDCTPLMEAASAGHVDIVSLLIAHGADVNAQSSSGNTPLMYGCAGGHEEVVKVLLEAGANVEDHNENGHTPLMEAASAGHVSVAKVLLEHGAGINTHSNEFKESALTLACYKGHLDMVRFLLSAGADQEHKTDEMHTALMEASMDGHVEVARLLLDSGAQVNMPTDSFESPLTLAACGGHVDLAMLLIERGANIEEVNDEGYTPLMEAAREGHEEMVALLLSQGANINAQTEETQETALTLACCGGFLEVADFLIKAGADIELGASTPLMEAAQEGHLDLVRYLLESNANVHAQTQTSDTALTYACENGHTDVVDILLQFGADLEHESEGGRTPLMKACRAGHLCTVQFLVSKKADVNRQTTNNDHTPLSLACAGGHLSVVELLLAQSADPFHKLKDNSTMLIEAAKGGHTRVVHLLLDYPHSIMINSSRDTSQSMLINSTQITRQPLQMSTQYILEQESLDGIQESVLNHKMPPKNSNQKSILRKTRSIPNFPDAPNSSAELQQIRSQPLRPTITSNTNSNIVERNVANQTYIPDPNLNVLASSSSSSSQVVMDGNNHENRKIDRHEQLLHKQQILEELQRVERELQIKGADHLYLGQPSSSDDDVDSAHTDQINKISNLSDADSAQNINEEVQYNAATQCSNAMESMKPPITEIQQNTSNITSALSFYKGFQQANKYYIEGFKEGIKLEKQRMLKEVRSLQETQLPLPLSSSVIENFSTAANDFSNTSISLITVPSTSTSITSIISNPSCISTFENTFSSDSIAFTGEICGAPQPITSIANVNQNTAISDRPKVKAVSKKDNKSVRKTVHGMVMNKLQQQHMALMAGLSSSDFQKFLEKTRPHCVQQVHQLQQLNQQLQLQLDQVQISQTDRLQEDSDTIKLHLQEPCPFFIDSSQYPKTTANDEIFELGDGSHIPIDEAVNIFESISFDRMSNDDADRVEIDTNDILGRGQQNVQQMINEDREKSRSSQEISTSPMTSLSTFNLVNSPSRNETNSTLVHTSSYQPLQKQVLNAFEAGLSIGIQSRLSDDNQQTQLVLQSNQIAFSNQSISPTSKIDTTDMSSDIKYSLDSSCLINQVQVATQTQLPVNVNTSAPLPERKSFINSANNSKGKKNKHLLGHHRSTQQSSISSSVQIPQSTSSQNYEIDSSTVTNNHTTSNFVETYSSNQIPTTPFSCMDVDSETDSNHDTALTLACAGGHEELVELLLSRGAEIEHRDKKGFTPLILAATAGHQKVVEILLNHGADLEAQSERTKDTPLSLACSGGRYEVVELLLSRAANKEHRNVSDYTPLSLAASGGYVNIIKLLLNHGAEINSRTGSKLGISPLMLAAMNGHTAAVKLLLDMGSDINAQIETNRNTALTLACFQGRHEVVSLLLDRKANVEHRAKTGLTPLMEAASGGYVEVGRVLLSKGADVNATPVPSSRDTALTIAADKGHCRFVELLLSKGTQVEVKNKKGNSPLWLAANGGHLNVVDLLYHAGADIDSQDNRKVSCLMAAFRKGHIKIVKWMVNHVTQFPSDQEMTRYIATINDKDLLERCQECVKIIRAAKETQAAKANKNATILLEELDMEKTREESKKAAAARRRERKKKKKLEKKEEKRKLHAENKRNEAVYKVNDMSETRMDKNGTYTGDYHLNVQQTHDDLNDHTTISNTNISMNEEAKDSSSCTNIVEHDDMTMREKKKDKKKKKFAYSSFNATLNENNIPYVHMLSTAGICSPTTSQGCFTTYDIDKHPADRDDFEATGNELCTPQKGKRNNNQLEIDSTYSNSPKLLNSVNPKYFGKRDEGWKEVVRKGQIEDSAKLTNSSFRSKKVSVPPNAISRVIGRGGSNINSIRAATGAHIEVEKQNKSLAERIITIKGSFEATRQAHILISALIKNPDVDIIQLLSKSKLPCNINTIFMEKPTSSLTTQKVKIISTKSTSGLLNTATSEHSTKPSTVTSFSSATYVLPLRSSATNRSSVSRFTTANDKKVLLHSMAPSNTKTTMSYTSAIMTAGRSTKVVATNISQTFAEKLSEINTMPSAIDYSNSIQSNQVPNNAVSKLNPPLNVSSVKSTIASNSQLYPQDTSANNILESGTILSLIPVFTAGSSHCSEKLNCQSVSRNLLTLNSSGSIISTTNSFSSQLIKIPQTTCTAVNSSLIPISSLDQCQTTLCNVPLEYSLFNDTFSKVTQQSMWGSKEYENQKNRNFAAIAGAKISVNASITPPKNLVDSTLVEVDASKAPGYRGTLTCSPTSNISTNLGSIANSSTGDDGPSSPAKITIQTENVQLTDFTNDHVICGTSKLPVNLIVSRPNLHQNNGNENVTSFIKATPCENKKSPENAATSHKGSDISLMSSQSTLELDMFNLNDDSSSFENQSGSSNLMKTVPSEIQTSSQSMTPIQRNIQKHPQTVMPSAIVTTTVSMSRLNPRAPDFSSSLHLGNKQQMTMFSASTPRPTVFPIMPAQPSTSVIHSSNFTMVGGFTYNKYQTPFLRPTNIGINNQHHWPFLATPNYTHQDQLISQANYSDHLIGIPSPSSNLDTINLENSCSIPPVMSLLPTGAAREISQIQIEDRKPRPIGTERTWKNYSMIGPGGDADNVNWILNQEKTTDSWSEILPNTDTNQLFDSNATFNRVLPNETDSHKIADSPFQGNCFGS